LKGEGGCPPLSPPASAIAPVKERGMGRRAAMQDNLLLCRPILPGGKVTGRQGDRRPRPLPRQSNFINISLPILLLTIISVINP